MHRQRWLDKLYDTNRPMDKNHNNKTEDTPTRMYIYAFESSKYMCDYRLEKPRVLMEMIPCLNLFDICIYPRSLFDIYMSPHPIPYIDRSTSRLTVYQSALLSANS